MYGGLGPTHLGSGDDRSRSLQIHGDSTRLCEEAKLAMHQGAAGKAQALADKAIVKADASPMMGAPKVALRVAARECAADICEQYGAYNEAAEYIAQATVIQLSLIHI